MVNGTVTGKVGQSGGEGFDGGHSVGNNFGGGSEFVNLNPQAAAGVNRAGGAFYDIETQWRTALTHDGSVTDVTIDIRYPEGAPMTPTTFKGQDHLINPTPSSYGVDWTRNGVGLPKPREIDNVNPEVMPGEK